MIGHNMSLIAEATRLGMLPRLNIDRVLLLCIVMSVVYVFLFNSEMAADDNGRLPRIRSSLKKVKQSAIVPGLKLTTTGKSSRYLRRHVNQKPPGVCSNKARMTLVHDVCRRNDITNYEYANDDNQSIKIAVIDDERKLFYCLIGKVGSKSWIDFLARTSKKFDGQNGNYRQDDFLESVGLKMLRNFPLSTVRNKYSDYFKFVVVRHPLQRLVSAYYEVIEKLHKYDDMGSESITDFKQFAKAVTGKMLDYNPHWRRYHNRCKLCHIDYDYIIKTETTEADVDEFNHILDVPPKYQIQHKHSNEALKFDDDDKTGEYDPYKYDGMLKNFQKDNPDLMKHILRVYGDDMEMFGYQWDSKRGKSLCFSNDNGTACC